MIDASAFQLLLMVVTGWLARREREVVDYLIEENRCLRRQLGDRRLRLTDNDRRRLGGRAYRVGRRALRDIATIATPRHVAAVAPPAHRAEMDVRPDLGQPPARSWSRSVASWSGWRKRTRRGATRGFKAR
mgnify:CR=1 FL=1